MASNNEPQTLNDLLRRNLDRLTTNITYIVLIGFILVLTILLIKAVLTDPSGTDKENAWLNLFRDGFLILSGILTTLIGYYFGNRGSNVAMKQAEELKKKSEELLAGINQEAPTNEDQDTGIDPI